MARYDLIYAALARRAVREGVTDAEAFIERAAASGMPPEVIEDQLINDLTTGGPIFGKFTRSLTAAAGGAVSTASAQGEAAALAYAEKLISMAEMDNILEDADAEVLDATERQLDGRQALVWVATLENTCHLCLPLHGKIDTREGWQAAGLAPETIHLNEGWKSRCQCQLIPSDEVDADKALEPLVRTKVKSTTGKEGSKRTQRAIAQHDIDRARAAIEKAQQTEQGRRTIRLMGQLNRE